MNVNAYENQDQTGIASQTQLTFPSAKVFGSTNPYSEILSISYRLGDIEVEFFFHIEQNRYYALFWNDGQLYLPGGQDLFNARTWETLREHIEISMRDADFVYFIGFFNRYKLEQIVKDAERKYEYMKEDFLKYI